MGLLNFNFAQDVVDRLAPEDRVGLVYVDEFGHRRDYRFAEISAQSQRYAAVLRAFGVTRGDRVLLRTQNTAKCIFTILGLQRLGAVPVPCMESWSGEQVLERALKTHAKTIVSGRSYRESVDAIRSALPADACYILIGEECEGWARLDSLVARAQPYSGVATQPDEPAFIVDETYSNRSLFDVRARAQERLGIGAADTVWCTLPMGCARWLATVVLAPWWCGAATVIHDGPFDPYERLDLVRELDVTVLCQPPEEYRAELEVGELSRLRLPRLRRCVCLGGIDREIDRRWRESRGIGIDDAINGVPLLQKA